MSLSRYDAETLLDNYNILISSARPCQYGQQPTSRDQRTNRRTDGAHGPEPTALSDRSSYSEWTERERGPDRTQQQRIIFARDWDQMSLGQHGQEEAVEEQLGQAASSGCDINFISRVGRNFHQSETGIGGGLQGNHAPANADSDARNA